MSGGLAVGREVINAGCHADGQRKGRAELLGALDSTCGWTTWLLNLLGDLGLLLYPLWASVFHL